MAAPINKSQHRTKFNALFNDVLELVEEGNTLERALCNTDYSIDEFYMELNKQQRLELEGCLAVCSEYGEGWEFEEF